MIRLAREQLIAFSLMVLLAVVVGHEFSDRPSQGEIAPGASLVAAFSSPGSPGNCGAVVWGILVPAE